VTNVAAELVVPAKLGAQLDESVPDPFPLVAKWRALDGAARAFVVGLALVFVGSARIWGPEWAVLIIGIVVTLDAMGLSFERRRVEE
jgi:hypothetical protein